MCVHVQYVEGIKTFFSCCFFYAKGLQVEKRSKYLKFVQTTKFKQLISIARGDGYCGWRSISIATATNKESMYGMLSPQFLLGKLL